MPPPQWLVWVAMVYGCATADLAAVDVQAAAARIDTLIEKGYARSGVSPNPDAGDEVFLRRTYLDIIGRIPTGDEATRFLGSRSSTRRHELIERLLDSEGYVSAQFEFWADLLRIQSPLMGRYPGEPYVDWVKQAIRANMPYDQFVTALVSAKGPILAAGNGATGYYLRDAGMPQDNMSNTIQVFLGTRLACAQCHNHPFDVWTRQQYLQMVAYTNGTKDEADPALVATLKRLASAQGEPSKDEAEAMRKWTDTVGHRLVDAGKDTISLPKDYQYPDGKPGQVVKAHAIFGTLAIRAGQAPREAYAAWLTAPDNPRFTLVIANRLWKRVMGIGLIEPVDNLTEQTVPSDPELMADLVDLMEDVGYDLKRFQEILYHTKLYGRAATTTPIPLPEQYRFPGPTLRRLSAEQVWDSLLTLIVPDLDERRLGDAAAMYAYYQTMSQKSPEEAWGIIKTIAATLQSRRELADQMRALEDAASDKNALHRSPEFAQLKEQQQTLDNALRDLSFDRLRGAQVPETDPRWKGFRRDQVRASELPSPAPAGHFLHDFGQSDRLLIDNANRSAAVTQALTLLNGFVDQEVFQPKTLLMRAVAAAPERDEKIRLLFLALLAREPTAADLAVFTPWMPSSTVAVTTAPAPDQKVAAKAAAAAAAAETKATDQLVRAVIWTLINSREFLFEQ